jgi:hypothetical protein
MSISLRFSDKLVATTLLEALVSNTPFAIYAVDCNLVGMLEGRDFKQGDEYIDIVDLEDDNYESLLSYEELQRLSNEYQNLCATTMELSFNDEYEESELPDDNLITFDVERIAKLKQELLALLNLLGVTEGTLDADMARITQYALSHSSTFSTGLNAISFHECEATGLNAISFHECEATQVWLSLQNADNNIYINVEVRSFFNHCYSQMESLTIPLSLRDVALLAFGK